MKGFEDFKPHHLPLTPEHVQGNNGIGRVFLLPGSDGRALRISERLEDAEVLPSDRRHNVYLGSYASKPGSGDAGGAQRAGEGGNAPTAGTAGQAVTVDVGTVATGMGCPSLDIVVTELIALGARRFIRVGTSGSLQPQTVKAGHLVIGTAAVRDEGVSDRYVVRDYPAVAHTDVVAALERAARRLGCAGKVFKGVIHSKDSLYAREMGYGPLAEENRRYVERLRQMGVVASEMEAAHLFVLSDVYSSEIVPLSGGSGSAKIVKSGAVTAIIGDESAFASPDLARQTESLAIDVALEGAAELIRLDAGA